MNINIATIAGGALIEQVDEEIRKVLENIADPNTDPEKNRKVIIHLTISGEQNREIADLSFQTKSVLVPARSQTTRIAFEKNGNQIVAEELRKGAMVGQVKIDPTGKVEEPAMASKVVSMTK